MLATITRFLVLAATLVAGAAAAADEVKVFQLPEGAGPHDVAPAPDGKVCVLAQGSGALGVIDPATGPVRRGAGREPPRHAGSGAGPARRGLGASRRHPGPGRRRVTYVWKP